MEMECVAHPESPLPSLHSETVRVEHSQNRLRQHKLKEILE
jgi:hypothetical protein